jgi:hypothetical protein
MGRADFHVLAEPVRSDQGLREVNRAATRLVSVTVAKAETKPETSLWKICAQAASLRVKPCEWIVFLLLGAVSLGALAYCFSESLHLFNRGALDE